MLPWPLKTRCTIPELPKWIWEPSLSLFIPRSDVGLVWSPIAVLLAVRSHLSNYPRLITVTIPRRGSNPLLTDPLCTILQVQFYESQQLRILAVTPKSLHGLKQFYHYNSENQEALNLMNHLQGGRLSGSFEYSGVVHRRVTRAFLPMK
jgi:hypothetical protein